MGLMVGLMRILPLCIVLLVLPVVAASSVNNQLLKHTVALWADGHGDVILERTLQNVDMVNWSNTTWYFDWYPGNYSQIRAWDDFGPLSYSTSQSGTRIYVTVNFRRPIQPGQSYHFSLAITIANMASVSGNNGRLSWHTHSDAPIQEFIRGVTFPSNSAFQSITPAPTSQRLNYLEWRDTNIPANGQYTIDVSYGLSEAIDVPVLLQTDMRWAANPYGRYTDNKTGQTIGDLGCAMTSAAMIINYWGGRSQLAFTTNPGVLNTWLRSNNFRGYNEFHWLIWDQIIYYADNENHVTLSLADPKFLGGSTPTNDQILDTFLRSGNPVVLGVNNNGHFVVATGKTIVNGQWTYTINDPLSGKTTLDKYNNTYSSAKLYSGAPADKRALSVSAHSPVELLIIDPQARRFGYDPATGSFLNEIPNAEYSLQSILANGIGPELLPRSKFINIYTPIDGRYTLTMLGTGSGDYTIHISTSNWLGEVSQETVHGTAQPGATYSQTTDYNSYTGINKPVFVYPVDGQTLDYAGSYLFKVERIANAQGFLWGFFQNGVLVWENLRDEGTLSSDEYGIHPATTAHSKFVPGSVEVWVRALIEGQWTDAAIITIYLR